MKKIIIILLVLAAAFVAVKLSIKSPDQSIPSASEETTGDTSAVSGVSKTGDSAEVEQISADRITASFTGYKPGGKTENGTVSASKSTLSRTGSVFSGAVTFDMTTISSTPVKEDLIKHLKNEDFFDVVKYSTATFSITSATNTQVKGTLTMKGITKPVTLPLSFDSTTKEFSSTVRVSMKDYGINQTFTDDEFVLTVKIK
jgi:polyisoprenoid-binding protein YceI